MAKREHISRRNEDIKAEFNKLKAERKYTHEYIISKLAEKYYLMPATIENIVYKSS